jgi:branched-chain amino acid transport system substrate-binding protein
VQVYVSNLRKVVGPERLITRDHGYELVAADDEVDASRFERLLDGGRAQPPEKAATLLRQALSLWRGSPLADLAYEPFAQAEIVRLEELRLRALEDRIEADLASGRAPELVAELQGLVREHTFRERLRGQLMRALYLSGRQADALAAYREGRTTLRDELGIEPAPELRELERAILTQDKGLGKPARPVATARARRRWLVAAGAGLLAAAVAAGVTVALTHSGTYRLPTLGQDSVAAFDPATGRMVGEVSLPIRPRRLAVLGTAAWAADEHGTVAEVKAGGKGPTLVVASQARASDLAAVPGGAWTASLASGRLAHVDAGYGAVTRRVSLHKPSLTYVDLGFGDSWSVAYGAGALWATDGSDSLFRVDSATGATRAIRLGVAANAVAVGAGAVWVASGKTGSVLAIDPHSGAVVQSESVVDRSGSSSPYPADIAVADGYVWVLDANTASVTKIDPRRRGIVATVLLGVDRQPRSIAAGSGAAWVADGDGTLARIDAATGALAVIPVGRELLDVAVAKGRVWLASGTALGLARTSAAPPTTVHAVSDPLCAPVLYRGRGTPRFLVTTTQPLDGLLYTFYGQPVLAATILVFEQHGFMAGRFPVALQVCNLTAASGMLDLGRCAPIARAAAADPSVIGVLASVASVCARREIPVFDRARGGPIGMVGSQNTVVGLTRASPEDSPGEPRIYYPTGNRNYVRISPADDYQSAGNALLAERLGLRRVFVLHDAFPYGIAIAPEFVRAARRRGIQIVADVQWNPNAGSYRRLASEIAARGADGVFLAGTLAANGVTLIRDLRARLGGGFPLLASDGFAPAADTAGVVGPAAEGLYVSTAGVAVDRLPPSGRRFVASFRKATGQDAPSFAAYAAEGAEVLLDAIARSDGTRASIVRELFRTRVRGGVIGDFRVTPTGDTTASAITIQRIEGGQAETFAVIVPPARLVRP